MSALRVRQDAAARSARPSLALARTAVEKIPGGARFMVTEHTMDRKSYGFAYIPARAPDPLEGRYEHFAGRPPGPPRRTTPARDVIMDGYQRRCRPLARAYPLRSRQTRGDSLDVVRGGIALRLRERPPLWHLALYRLFHKRLPYGDPLDTHPHARLPPAAIPAPLPAEEIRIQPGAARQLAMDGQQVGGADVDGVRPLADQAGRRRQRRPSRGPAERSGACWGQPSGASRWPVHLRSAAKRPPCGLLRPGTAVLSGGAGAAPSPRREARGCGPSADRPPCGGRLTASGLWTVSRVYWWGMSTPADRSFASTSVVSRVMADPWSSP